MKTEKLLSASQKEVEYLTHGICHTIYAMAYGSRMYWHIQFKMSQEVLQLLYIFFFKRQKPFHQIPYIFFCIHIRF